MKLLMPSAALIAMLLLSTAEPAAQTSGSGVVIKTQAGLMATLAERGAVNPAPVMIAANVKTGDGFMINLVRRTRPQGAIAHDVGTEIHSLVEGAATLVTGGTIVRPDDPAQRMNATIRDGDTRRVRAGDLVLVPPQTPHWYSAVDQVVTYVEIRFDVGAPPGGAASRMTEAALRTLLTDESAKIPPPVTFSAPVSAGERFRADVVVRTRPQDAEVHERDTEVLHILEGTATLVTGGRLLRAADSAASLEEGDSADLHVGDVVVIPANVPHWFKAARDLRYLEVRFDLPKP